MQSSNLFVSAMEPVLRCQHCSMTFKSDALLNKHRSRFCVGSTADPNDLQLRRGFRSISPPRHFSPGDRDDYRRPNNDHIQNLAQEHGRQMHYLQSRNKDLEKQREDILKKLEGLGRRSVIHVPQQDNTAELMRELREQENRNRRALEDLRKQLLDMNNNQKVNVIEIERPAPMAPAPAPLPPPPPVPEQKKQFVLPVYYGKKSLVAEISAIRQAYLLNGGNDPEILANMAQMLAEAQAIEDAENQKPEKKSPREKPNNNMEMMRFMERENERLIQELRLLQQKPVHTCDRSDREDELQREIHRLQQDHLGKMYWLQKEMDDMKLMLMMEKNKPGPMPQSTVIHQAPPNQVNLKPYVEVEAMPPYDQYVNRFDKRRVTTASRTWMATHHTKFDGRPLIPLKSGADDSEDEDEEEQQDTNILHAGSTPRLNYNPQADESMPFLTRRYQQQMDNYMETGKVWNRDTNDGMTWRQKMLLNQPSTQSGLGTALTDDQPARNRTLRSQTPGYALPKGEPRTGWGNDLEGY